VHAAAVKALVKNDARSASECRSFRRTFTMKKGNPASWLAKDMTSRNDVAAAGRNSEAASG
jgi:hypothetical protein